MARKTYRRCKFCNDFHDVDNWPDNHREWIPDNRSELASPSVINGSVDYLQSQADGKIYTCKRTMRREQRAQGFVEVGNENPGAHRKTLDKKAHRAKVVETVKKAASQNSLRKPTLTQKQARKVRRKERAST